MAKLGKEQQKAILITAGIIIATLVIGVKIIYRPQNAQAIKLKAEIKKETDKNSLISEIISGQNEIKHYQERFSPEEGTGWLENKLNQLADNLGLKLLGIKPKAKERENSGLLPLTVEVKLEGSYHKIGKLVSQLEKSSEFIEVNKIKMSSASSQAWDKLVQAGEEAVVSTAGNWRRSRKPAPKEQMREPKIDQAGLETILSKSKEVEAVLEVSTYYVQ
jgi:Tfp pilus assembly protein PilO